MRILTLLLALLAGGNAAAYTLELSDKELQQAVQGHFPIVQETLFSRVTLSRPEVRLNAKSNRIGLAVSVALSVQKTLVGQGRGLIDGTLEYRAKTGEFYLRDPRLRQVRLSRVKPEYNTLVRDFLGGLTRQAFPFIVVYRLQDDDLRQRMLKASLKSVRVRGGKVLVEMGLP